MKIVRPPTTRNVADLPDRSLFSTKEWSGMFLKLGDEFISLGLKKPSARGTPFPAGICTSVDLAEIVQDFFGTLEA